MEEEQEQSDSPIQMKALYAGKVAPQRGMKNGRHALGVLLLPQLSKRSQDSANKRRVVVRVGCRALPVGEVEVVVESERAFSPLVTPGVSSVSGEGSRDGTTNFVIGFGVPES
jgi:hypothetical protein